MPTGAAPPRLYVVTDRHATGGRPLVDVVAAALAGAAPFRDARGRVPVAVQLREKDLPGGPLLALARGLRAVTAAAGAALFVNDRVDVALACGADGVHLPEAGLAPATVRAIAPGLAVARSTHDVATIAALRTEPIDFVVFGPVFATPSKQGILPARGLAALADAARLGVPVVALGGITEERARACRQSGAFGVACIRSVVAEPDPASAVTNILRVVVA